MQTKNLSSRRLALVATALVMTSISMPPEVQAAGTETIILNVEGMWNESCEEYISNSLLGDLEGVLGVVADHDSDVVTVDFDPAGTSAEEVAAAIEDCPLFDVTGSETHELDEELIKKSRRSCCSAGCRYGDV